MNKNIDLFDEKRKSKKISELLSLSNDYWYTTQETTSTEYTYSTVKLLNEQNEFIYPNGKRGLLIGVNPRMTSKTDYKKEIEEYILARNNNPNIKHRNSCGDNLEATRRNAIIDLLENNKKCGIKELITIDLFAHRTHKSNELIAEIKKYPKELERIIGSKNEKILLDYIDSDEIDIIIIAWGDILKILKALPDYCNKLLSHLEKNIEKIWWYGANKNGSAKHAAYRKKSNFRQIDIDELKAVFNIAND
ncbi:MAG: DUF1643 domain-containing protein [Oscillospiraceae bacterium]